MKLNTYIIGFLGILLVLIPILFFSNFLLNKELFENSKNYRSIFIFSLIGILIFIITLIITLMEEK